MHHLVRLVVVAIARLLSPILSRAQTRVEDLWLSFRSNGWFTVYGVIHQALIGSNDGGYFLVLTYSYEHLGEYYSGRRRREVGRERAADQTAAIYGSGTSVVVRVHPRKPEKSVLIFRDQLVESQNW